MWIEKYMVVDMLGDGYFGKVYSVKDQNNNLLAAKVCSYKNKKDMAESFTIEALIMLKLSHKNILSAKRAFLRCKHQDFVIITDICDGGNLAQLLPTLQHQQRQPIMLGIAEGLAYLHQKCIIHRDVKPANILLKNGIPKISDFGLSKWTVDNAVTHAGTDRYIAPEMLQQKQYGNTVDVWSLGIVFLEMLLGVPLGQITKSKPHLTNPFPSENILSQLPSHNAKNLICMMLIKSPQQRIKSREVVDFLRHYTI